MSYAIHWGGVTEDVVLRVWGPADEGEFVEAVRTIRSAPDYRTGMRVLIDERDVDWTQVTATDIRRRATTLLAEERPAERLRVAVVVERKLAFGLIRMLQAYIEGDTSSTGRVFYDLDSARDWLGQPA